jgi:hypothetical protein
MADSDDDKPISQLAIERLKNSKAASAAVPQTATIPSTGVIRVAPQVKKESKPAVTSAKANAASDDEDDIPLAVLMKRKLAATASSEPGSKKQKVEATKKSSKPSESKSKKSEKDKKKKHKKGKKSSHQVVSSSGASSRTSVYYESEKGKVVQALLVRWWYAIQWPEPGSIPKAPDGFEALDGYPGVFVGTRVSICRC